MIRRAGPEDAGALAALQLRAWLWAYADFVDSERFGTLEERVARWERFLAQPAAERTTHVHDLGGLVSGFAAIGPARDADLGSDVGELLGLYVDPPAQGAGVGGALLTDASERLRAAGFASAALWVFAANGHGRQLYETRGWVLDDSDAARAAHGEDWWAPAVRYRLAL